MLAPHLIQLIERHWEEISSRLIAAIRQHPDMEQLSQRPDVDIREWCQSILEDLGYLISAPKREEVKRRFEVLGRTRFEEKIPLHEAVLRVHLLKDEIVEFIHEQGFPMTSLELYAEEELEHRIGQFFDALVYRLVRGYEDAMRRAKLLAS
jgi:hypothetical protein